MLLYQLLGVDQIWFESAHAVASLTILAEPEIHLTEHVLVDFLQRLRLLLCLRLLLVERLVWEFLEVLRVDLLHDEVQAA